MCHSSIESLESRWAPARLVGGPLPAEFGASLEPLSAEEAQLLVPDVEGSLPEIFGDLVITPVSSGQVNLIPVPVDWEGTGGLVNTAAGTLTLSGNYLGGSLSIGNVSLGGASSRFDFFYVEPISIGTISSGSVSFTGATVVARPVGSISYLGVSTPSYSGGTLMLSGSSVIMDLSMFVPIGVSSNFAGGGELPENVVLQLDVAGPSIPVTW